MTLSFYMTPSFDSVSCLVFDEVRNDIIKKYVSFITLNRFCSLGAPASEDYSSNSKEFA